MSRFSFALTLGSLLAACATARAVVEAEMPLAQLVQDSQLIVVATLEEFDREGAKGVLKIERVLQGDNGPASVPIKLVAPAGGEGNPQDMLDRVEEGTPLVLFLSQLGPREHQAFAYTRGSWFKLRGVDELSQLKAVFVQGEPYLRRTFGGDEVVLVKLLDGFLAAKEELPEIDKTAEPGLGPTLHETGVGVAAATPNQIELGPAWQTDERRSGQHSALPAWGVGSLLLIAAAGLLYMLTRSVPERAA